MFPEKYPGRVNIELRKKINVELSMRESRGLPQLEESFVPGQVY